MTGTSGQEPQNQDQEEGQEPTSDAQELEHQSGDTEQQEETDPKDILIAKLRQESAKRRVELRELQAKEQEREKKAQKEAEAALEEQERYKELASKRQDQIGALEGQIERLQGYIVAQEVTMKALKGAQKLNFKDPAIAQQLLPQDAYTVETDWGGDKIVVQVEGLEGALEKLAKEHPYLLEEDRAPGGPGPRPAKRLSKRAKQRAKGSGVRIKL